MPRHPLFPCQPLAFVFVCFLLLGAACGSGNSAGQQAGAAATPPAVPPAMYDAVLARGVVTDSVHCRNHPEVSYAVYLPSDYDTSKAYPCLYFFDAHARGALPVTAYKTLAERYGFVFIGSDCSKNGLPAATTLSMAQAMIDDAGARIHIDARRVYAAGFSGGSRVVASVAIELGGIAGVIGCAAGLPKSDHGISRQFAYFGIAGDFDFNLSEMEQLDAELEQNQYTHQLLTTGGIHGWPPVADFGTALLWMQVAAMKERVQPEQAVIVDALKKNMDERLTAAMKAGEWIRAHQLCAGMARLLSGWKNNGDYAKRDAAMVAGAAYTRAVNERATLRDKEINLQRDLVAQLSTKDEAWWRHKINELRVGTKGSSTIEETKMNRRLLSYLGLVCYMKTSRALAGVDGAQAAVFLRVFSLLEPENPDVSYLRASLYMLNGDRDQALASLQTAVHQGYSDVAQMESDPVFAALREDAVFQKIMTGICANSRSGKLEN